MIDEVVDINEMYYALIEGKDEEGNVIHGDLRKPEKGKEAPDPE